MFEEDDVVIPPQRPICHVCGSNGKNETVSILGTFEALKRLHFVIGRVLRSCHYYKVSHNTAADLEDKD
jgi:hypothetical protein